MAAIESATAIVSSASQSRASTPGRARRGEHHEGELAALRQQEGEEHALARRDAERARDGPEAPRS